LKSNQRSELLIIGNLTWLQWQPVSLCVSVTHSATGSQCDCESRTHVTESVSVTNTNSKCNTNSNTNSKHPIWLWASEILYTWLVYSIKTKSETQTDSDTPTDSDNGGLNQSFNDNGRGGRVSHPLCSLTLSESLAAWVTRSQWMKWISE